MRTTLNLDEELLAFARQLAERRRVSLGDAVNLLLRRGMERAAGGGAQAENTVRNGLPLLTLGKCEGARVDRELVATLAEDAQ